jgi:hypothetical protein
MKYKIKHPSNRVLIFILLIIIAAQTALIGYLGLKTQILWEQVQGCSSSQNQQGGCLGTFPALDYVRDSNNSIYANAGIADTGATKISFPELKISLPYSQDARSLRYSYVPKSNDTAEVASFSTYNLMNAPIYKFDDIPCHQFVAGLSVDKPEDSFWQHEDQVDTLKLKDGRTLYLYENSLKSCTNSTKDKVIELLKQAQSY